MNIEKLLIYVANIKSLEKQGLAGSSMVEQFSSMHEALGPIPSTVKKNQKRNTMKLKRRIFKIIV